MLFCKCKQSFSFVTDRWVVTTLWSNSEPLETTVRPVKHHTSTLPLLIFIVSLYSVLDCCFIIWKFSVFTFSQFTWIHVCIFCVSNLSNFICLFASLTPSTSRSNSFIITSASQALGCYTRSTAGFDTNTWSLSAFSRIYSVTRISSRSLIRMAVVYFLLVGGTIKDH